MPISLYCYRAKVTNVYDGDTCTVDIDLGLNTWRHGEKLRLNRINTPELRGDDRLHGLLARDYLRKLVLDREVLLQTISDKKGKFGRYLAEIWLLGKEGKWINVNDTMIASGHASYYQNNAQVVKYDVNEFT